jgi:hypothetical protein
MRLKSAHCWHGRARQTYSRARASDDRQTATANQVANEEASRAKWDHNLNLLAAAAAATTNGRTNWVLVTQVMDC